MENELQSRRVATSDDIEISTYLELAKELHGEQPVIEAKPPTKPETIVVIDFGSQYSMLIARRIREHHVYCELVPYDTPGEKIASLNPKGFILSGGPLSVYEPGVPLPLPYVYESHLPVLGICYGMQAIVHQLGGEVISGAKHEYGHAILHINALDCPLFADLPPSLPVWMSHGDQITKLPPTFSALAYTENSPFAAIGNDRNIFGLQFHPEVSHTPQGKTILQNFVYRICGCHGDWTSANFISENTRKIREQVGEGRVICALSGGVDSAVTATLIDRAIGNKLTCIFINNGLLRREEPERVFNTFKRNLKMDVVCVDAAERFLERLRGVTDPEEKRRLIGNEFIQVFEEEAAKLGKVNFLAQGTLYPDVIESTSSETKAAAKIKSHHNVGGLPPKMKFTLIEPLRYLFKDEVREVGLTLGLPEEMVWRQPFPGPGLAIRIVGEVTKEKLATLRAADWIVMNEIKKAKLYRQLWQSFAVLTDVKSVGIMGDFRTYGYLIAVRAITSNDAMTADWARLPHDLLARISDRIVNEVSNVNRVVYDITSKPPATIEWE
ncbi:MAG: glutamine-hydrolyzing GMP synthase [Chloroflexi bacterium CG_4_9_14_3_um_filter_45_9]|nr:MAG: glutamine-hydrolyzing GMP synthase [Dehalococcoidia bacterium CG2_30_46_9]PIU23594.1 MAG: glutamine-hydrolyzing GMP synthase [Chloroflexi bacterium CG08_land_8_20_14_0_20_45_12]PIX27381.1 MAG: glutamine-hydrolyzing GMP synthase [Chloroflexi bacterium CG_4_8_14_3_um_filter_45_15]PJB47866.1 MAG: glutamine-hydrolyzing GMP synthase [Chloroflexi bacterium CG_4_9_14_3_um_filter_45_9]